MNKSGFQVPKQTPYIFVYLPVTQDEILLIFISLHKTLTNYAGQYIFRTPFQWGYLPSVN
jgi:hypothetical protein